MAAERIQRRPLSRRKRFVFCCVLLVALSPLAEVSAFLFYSVHHGRLFSWHTFGERRSAIANPVSSVESVHANSLHVVHPYVGFVLNADYKPDTLTNSPSISEFGYTDENFAVQRRRPGECIVAIVGGSVAQEFAFRSSELVDELRRYEPFSELDFTVLNLAHGGYKQPQQLMTITYLLTLGAEFDLVINLDGFNEVALHAAENGPLGVFLAYPRNWPGICAGIPDQAVLKQLRRRDVAIDHRHDLASLFSQWPLKTSVIGNLIWNWRDAACAKERQDIEHQIRAAATQRSQYLETGPRNVELLGTGAVYDQLAGVWQRSSLLLHQLCQANGIRYYHFLQPNQYIADSKVLGEDERAQAFDPQHAYRQGVERGYPLLQEKGKHLIAQGVDFEDLTQVFADTREPIYRDTCCHVNDNGNDILATVVARSIAQVFSKNNSNSRTENRDF